MPNAIVTGGTQGIGKAVVEILLKHGWSVAFCARTESAVRIQEQRWRQQYPDVTVAGIVADFGEKADVVLFAEAVLSLFSRIDILVNNTGLFFPGKLAGEPEGQLEYLMTVNLYSAYHLTRKILPVMKAAGSGHIFNICSVASLKAYENGGAYSITKYALQGFSDNLRYELMEDNIKVTAFMPGATWSRSWSESGLPEERFMQPQDIAAMLWSAYNLSAQATVETIIIRPLAGDI